MKLGLVLDVLQWYNSDMTLLVNTVGELNALLL